MESSKIKGTNRIKIHYIDTPSFTVGEKLYRMEDRMISSFSDIDSIIDRKLLFANKENIEVELAIYNIRNMYDDKSIVATTGEFISFFRHKFFKSTGELPIPIN